MKFALIYRKFETNIVVVYKTELPKKIEFLEKKLMLLLGLNFEINYGWQLCSKQIGLKLFDFARSNIFGSKTVFEAQVCGNVSF